jgi:hypothetical protein
MTMAGVLVLPPFLFGPILVKYKNWHSANPEFTEVARTAVRREALKYFDECHPQLRVLGFELVAYLNHHSAANGIQSVVMHMYNRASAERVTSVVIISNLRYRAHTQFIQKYSDGTSINTNNSRVGDVFKLTPARKVFRFPSVENLAEMYRLHRALIRREEAPLAKEAVLPDPGQEVDSFRRAFISAFEEQAGLGYYTLDPSGQRYYHTWKGACFHTWKLAWPVNRIGQTWGRLISQPLMRGLGVV